MISLLLFVFVTQLKFGFFRVLDGLFNRLGA